MLVDIDVFRTDALPEINDDLVPLLTQMKEIEARVFESSITDRSREDPVAVHLRRLSYAVLKLSLAHFKSVTADVRGFGHLFLSRSCPRSYR